nr:type IV pilin-like G/H family protein [Ancylothrix sp. D3o]
MLTPTGSKKTTSTRAEEKIMQLKQKKDSLKPETNPPETPTPYQRPKKFPGLLIRSLVFFGSMGFLIFVPSFFTELAGCGNKARQVEARQNVGVMNRAQQAYYLENKSFAKDIQALEIGIKTETNNYSYSLRSTGNASYHYAISKQGLNTTKSYVSAVFLVPSKSPTAKDEILFKEIVCEAEKAGKIQPANPTFINNKPTCDPNTQQIYPYPER